MSNTNTGGPAFPVHRPVAPENTPYAASMVISDGMTLRDYFAAKAMQGLIAYPHTAPNATAFDFANAAYEMADAMLEARDK